MADFTDLLSKASAIKPAHLRETLDEAAERLGLPSDQLAALRQLSGAKLEEIRSVHDTEDGPVVNLAGTPMVYRSADNPDANGATGWLFLARPDGGARRAGDDPDAPLPDYSTPIFARPVEDDDEVAEPQPAKRATKKAAAKADEGEA